MIHPHVKRRALYGFIVFLVTMAAYAYLIWTIPPARTWIALKTTAEFFQVEVTRPELSVIQVQGLTAVSLDSANLLNGCVKGFLTPVEHAIIKYRRGKDNGLNIILVPPEGGKLSASFSDENKGYATVNISGSIVLTAIDKCSGDLPNNFPIWGRAKFGEELKAADGKGQLSPGTLRDGTIEVYAHSQQHLLGLNMPASVYSVMSFDIPGNSVLTTESAVVGGNVSTADYWIGSASLTKDSDGFEVQATSRATSLLLSSAAIFGADDAAQKIDLGRYTQFTSDPNILLLQLIAGVFLVILSNILSIVGFFTPAQVEQDDFRPEQKTKAKG